MAKCKNEQLLSKINVKKIDKDNMEVTFEVLSDLPDCKKINTKNYYDTVSGSQSYNPFDRPVDVFECNPKTCNNTGTLTLTAEEEQTTASVSYKIPYDAREFVAGVITFYVKKAVATAETVVFKIFGNNDDANYDEYDVSVTGEGFQPVVIDLSKAPDTTGGTGWQASENGACVTITMSDGDGVSSISVFDDVVDFETSSVVKVGCLSEVGGTIDLDVATATCWESGYDTTERPTIERTITGNSVTPNYWKLNPMMGREKMVKGFKNVTVMKELVEQGDYAIALLPDAKEDECGFYGATIADVCDFSIAERDRLTLPVGFEVDEKHFIIGPNPDGGKIAYFHKSLAGQNVIIAYPKDVDVIERVAEYNNIGSVRCRMSYTTILNDGTEVLHTFDNVLVTSFPDNITNEETEFSFTINIQPDNAGVYYREGRIIG